MSHSRYSSRVAALLLTVLSCQVVADERAVEPTDFEKFISKPGVVIDSTIAIGSVLSSDATLEVSVLIATDTANPEDRISGLRLKLESNSGIEHVYLDPAQIAATTADLALIEDEIPELESSQAAPYRVQGTASCWRPAHPARILCPGYRVGPDGSGMTLAAYGGMTFDFPDRRPSELALLFDRASATNEAR